MTGKNIFRGMMQAHFNYFPNAVFLQDGLYVMAKSWEDRPAQEMDRKSVFEELRNRAKLYASSDPLPENEKYMDFETLVGKVNSMIFPKTFFCRVCGRVVQSNNEDDLLKLFDEFQTSCRNGTSGKPPHDFKIGQIWFCSVCSCGHIGEAFFPKIDACQKHYDEGFPAVLNTNNSDRFNNFEWKCSYPGCGHSKMVFGRPHECNDAIKEIKKDEGKKPNLSSIEMVTKNVVSIPEFMVRVNLMDSRRLGIMMTSDWESGVVRTASGDVEMPVDDIQREIMNRRGGGKSEIPDDVLERWRLEDPGLYKAYMERIGGGESGFKLPERRTINELFDFLLAVNQPEDGKGKSLRKEGLDKELDDMGLQDVIMAERMNLTYVLYGYSRGEFQPKNRVLNLFNRQLIGGGKQSTSVFCNSVESEALIFLLKPMRIKEMLQKNGIESSLDDAKSDREVLREIVNRYDREEHRGFHGFDPQKRTMTSEIYKTVHTYSHLVIKSLGRMSGVEENSIAEMLFPTRCAFMVFVNQKGNFNMGTLKVCFEENMVELLGKVKERAQDCMMDPVCLNDAGGSCPACLQMGEVSCTDFNLNMSRKYIVGGGGIRGYLED